NNNLVTELARILNVTEIDESTLQLCIKLLDLGIDPETLALKIKSVNQETQTAL
ncbi:uncharacterized protein CANTADRAFT_35971, partial [Suhomyces tanzawaensis NRRL Y-17324]